MLLVTPANMGPAWPGQHDGARNKSYPGVPALIRRGQEKAPRVSGRAGRSEVFVHEVMRTLRGEEHMLPAVPVAVAAIEQNHLVAVDVGIEQAEGGDLVHAQFGVVALEYQCLSHGIILGHGVDAGPKLLVEVRLKAVLAHQTIDDGIEVEVVGQSAPVDLVLAQVADDVCELQQQGVQVHVLMRHGESLVTGAGCSPLRMSQPAKWTMK